MYQNNMYTEFEKFFENMMGQFQFPRTPSIEVEHSEYDDEIVFSAVIPDISKDNIMIRRDDDSIIVRTEQDISSEIFESNTVTERRINLPQYVDFNSGEAKFLYGILTIRFDKVETDEEQDIDIQD